MQSLRKYINLYVVAALGLVLSIALYIVLISQENTRAKLALEQKSDVRSKIITDGIEGAITLLSEPSVLYENSGQVTSEEFEAFSKVMTILYPGVYELAIVKNMSHNPEKLNLQISQYYNHVSGLQNEANFPKSFLLNSASYLEAAKQQKAIIVPEIDLKDQQKTFLNVVYPLYKSNSALNRNIPDSFMLLKINVAEMISTSLKAYSPRAGGYDFYIYNSEIKDRNLLHFHPSRARVKQENLGANDGADGFLTSTNHVLSGDHRIVTLNVANAQWHFVFKPFDNNLIARSSWVPELTALLCLVLIIVLVSYLYTRANSALMKNQVLSQTISLMKNEAEIRAIVDTVLDGIITLDEKGVIGTFNSGAESIFGYNQAEAIGQNVSMLMPEPHHSDDDSAPEDHISSDTFNVVGASREIIGKRKDGSTFPMSLAVGKVKVRDKHLFTSVVRDISERKEYEQNLIEAKQQAELANRAKSDFLSSMNHELRTPLNAILGYSQLFSHADSLSEAQKNNAREIQKASNHLLGLIDSVLDLAKIEAGHILLSMEKVDLLESLQECHTLMAPMAAENNVTLKLDIKENTPPFLFVDNTRLKQVLLNLLSNAIKYNRKNGTVEIGHQKSENGFMTITIRDTGRGISEDQIKKLFVPFNRLDAEFSNIKGTGIGLTITRQLVELMGGSITVESTPDVGSVFSINLQEYSSEHDQQNKTQKVLSTPKKIDIGGDLTDQEIDTIDKESFRILIAEDNITNQDVLVQQLNLIGYTADVVDDGQEAWLRLQKESYDILLTDIHMPNLTGIQLTKQIRKQESLDNSYLPIIAFTANTMDGEAEKCIAIGMDDFVAKPITLEELKRVLSYWARKNTSSVAMSQASHAEEIEDVVEDEDSPIDPSMLKQLVGDNVESHKSLLTSFLNSSPEIIEAMEHASQEQDAEEITRLAHKLKSSARSMGANEMTFTCQMLETAGKEQDMKEIQELSPTLRGLLADVKSYVERTYGTKDPAVEKNIRHFHELDVMLVDDDSLMLDVITLVLNELDITEVTKCLSAETALTKIDKDPMAFDVVFCDLHMPQMDGIEFLKQLSKRDFSGGVILVSGADIEFIHSAEKLASDYHLNILGALEKPATPAEIAKILENLNITQADDINSDPFPKTKS